MNRSLTLLLQATKNAGSTLAGLSSAKKNAALASLARVLEQSRAEILAENKKDVKSAAARKLSSAYQDRLAITPSRFNEMLSQVKFIANAKNPIGEIIETKTLKNGIMLKKIRVPIGVIAIIYESRPAVTIDVAALCIKSGNACVLKGGSDAQNTNRALAHCITQALAHTGVPREAVLFLDMRGRKAVSALLQAREYIDVLIPRGGNELVQKVANESVIPVLYHAEGGARIYIDESANVETAVKLCVNAKTSRPAPCNSLDTVVVHARVAGAFLPLLAKKLAPHRVEIRGDKKTRTRIKARIASTKDYTTEFLDLILAVKVVDTLDEAIRFITKTSKRHSEGVIARKKSAISRFVNEIDAAALFVNCSTRLHDGGVFEMGAEVGIATGKLHARGPVGLYELTTYKWVAYGSGQVRE